RAATARFAVFHQRLEAQEIVVERVLGVLAEQRCDQVAERARGRAIAQLHPDAAGAVAEIFEAHATRALEVAAGQRAPGDQLLGLERSDGRVPADARAGRALRGPA